VAADADQSHSSVALRRVLRLLENLNATNSGSTIYQHIERSFHDLESVQLKTEHHYIELLELLFDALIQPLGKDSPLQTHAHILRTSLVPPMQPNELQQLQLDTKKLIAQLLHQRNNHDTLEHAFDPLLSPSHNRNHQASSHAVTEHDLEEAVQYLNNDGAMSPIPSSNHPFQETRANILNIKAKLGEQINLASEYNTELAQLIKESMEAIRLVDGKQSIDEMRIDHLRRYIRLFKEHQNLTTKFSDIHQQLNEVEHESQQIDDELNRVHLLSLTDELTQLPNRRALMQRLDDEVTRVQRYGSPLALAIIDLDEFKPINDTFGHNAGDAVLRYFAEIALSVCRHHDTVSRYGGEEFALLMPNTELDGALCALKKIQNEMSGSLCRVDDGVEIQVPTFSAGVALYNPGEPPEELIKRADTAMYRAKRSGRNRIEVHTMGTRQKSCQK
jgi:diguanylate cyclase (GGDEF)-like protein